ncbi:MAG TPA: RNA-binding protein, partial [Polyangiaceae bacterium]|nr:RNA-binding protein [Polyangiaceae bacterium]
MGNRLYVGNLSFHTTTDVLRQAFAASGEVTDAHVVTDRETGRSRGFGFITMADEAQAQAAIQAMNGADLDGRPLRVNEAEERPQRGGGGGFGGGDVGLAWHVVLGGEAAAERWLDAQHVKEVPRHRGVRD